MRLYHGSNTDVNRDNKYDIVIGPIANDDMALLFRQYDDGMIWNGYVAD